MVTELSISRDGCSYTLLSTRHFVSPNSSKRTVMSTCIAFYKNLISKVLRYDP